MEAGIEVVEFSGETGEQWLARAQETGWAAIEEIDAEQAAELKACLVD